MKLNLDLDEPLAARVEAAARARGLSPRDFIRAAIEQALDAPVQSPAGPPPFVQKTHDFGAHFETTWTLLAEIESNEYVAKNNRK